MSNNGGSFAFPSDVVHDKKWMRLRPFTGLGERTILRSGRLEWRLAARERLTLALSGIRQGSSGSGKQDLFGEYQTALRCNAKNVKLSGVLQGHLALV